MVRFAAITALASCSIRIPMTCSSESLLRVMSPSRQWAEFYFE